MKNKILILILLFSLFFIPLSTNAKTLRDLKNDLINLKDKKSNISNEKKLTEEEMQKIYKEIEKSKNKITESENFIKKLTDEIEQLNNKSKEKELEIKEVLHFLQIANGESAYLEYIFGAKDITDLIYRSAITSQLVSYNNDLINDYNENVNSNKKKQQELVNEINSLSEKQNDLQKDLLKLGNELNSKIDVFSSIEEQIASSESLIYYYEVTMKCGLDEDITLCGTKIPYSNSFSRPVVNGRITSSYGWRCYETAYGTTTCDSHAGIDLSGSNYDIYAAAPGVVKVVEDGPSYLKNNGQKSCGGNKIYIHHIVNGQKYTTAYFHVKNVRVKVGDVVDQNTIIATMGGGPDTWWYDNCSNGAHLHFAIASGHYFVDYKYYSEYVAHMINPIVLVNFPNPGVWFSNRITKY